MKSFTFKELIRLKEHVYVSEFIYTLTFALKVNQVSRKNY